MALNSELPPQYHAFGGEVVVQRTSGVARHEAIEVFGVLSNSCFRSLHVCRMLLAKKRYHTPAAGARWITSYTRAPATVWGPGWQSRRRRSQQRASRPSSDMGTLPERNHCTRRSWGPVAAEHIAGGDTGECGGFCAVSLQCDRRIGRPVGDGVWVEYHHIGVAAHRQQPALLEPLPLAAAPRDVPAAAAIAVHDVAAGSTHLYVPHSPQFTAAGCVHVLRDVRGRILPPPQYPQPRHRVGWSAARTARG